MKTFPIPLAIVVGIAHVFAMVFVAVSVSEKNLVDAWFHSLWLLLDGVEAGIGPACAIGRWTAVGPVSVFVARQFL